jgi:hypothetical protein
MDVEDGVIWVYGNAEESVMAFTDFGIETLTDLIKIHKDDLTILQRWKARKYRGGWRNSDSAISGNPA